MTLRTLRTFYIKAFDLQDEIEGFNYTDLITELYDAKEGDKLILNINSPGGRVDVGMEIVDAIQDSNATVVGYVQWNSCSMAAVIALACDNLVFRENTYLMFHTYSGGVYGKSTDIVPDVQHTDNVIKKAFSKICSPFLTKKELKQIDDGAPIYIRSDQEDLKERMKRHFKTQIMLEV